MQSDYLEGKKTVAYLLIHALQEIGGPYQPFCYTGPTGDKSPCVGVRLDHPNDLFLLGYSVGSFVPWRWGAGRPSLDWADTAKSSAAVAYWPSLPWVDVDDPE